MSQDNSVALVQFQELPAIAAGAPEALQKNTTLLTKAKDAGQTLLDTIEAEGMTPDLDNDCNAFMGKVSIAVTRMNDARSPITKMLTAISKEFTRLEAELDKTKADTIPYKIQEARNKYAREIAAEQRRKEQELRNKQLAESEKVDIRAKVELTVREKYNSVLFAYKKKYNDLFNTMTLDNTKEIKADLDKIPLHYPRSKFDEIGIPITAIYVPATELPGLIYDSRAALYDECSANFRDNMEALKHHLLDQIPARTQELKDMAKASKAEQERLQKAAQLRQQEEELRLAQENARKEQEALAQAAVTKDIGQAAIAFEKDVAMAEIVADAPAVKHSYVIQVYTPVGWMTLINLWFQEFGNKLSSEKLASKKLESMKTDLEKLAFNGGTKLGNSLHLEYIEDVKAVTKKV